MSEPTRSPSPTSKAAGAWRFVLADSAVYRLIALSTQWSRQMDDRLQAGVRGDWSEERDRLAGRRIRALAASSRVLGAFRLLLNAPTAALPYARVARLIAPLAGLPAPQLIAAIGMTVVVSVLTNAVLLAAVGTPLSVVGWSFRAAVLLAGAVAIWRPGALWAAIGERRARR